MIYLIFDYLEGGPEHLAVTTDIAKVPVMFDEWLEAHGEHHGEPPILRERLKAALALNTVDRHSIGTGWGSVDLIIAKEWAPGDLVRDPEDDETYLASQ